MTIGEEIEKIITRLDDYLELRTVHEKYILMLITPLLLLFVSFWQITPRIFKKINTDLHDIATNNAQHEANKREIEECRLKLSAPVSEPRLNALQEELTNIQQTRYYVDGQIEQKLDFLIYSQERWANFLDAIPRYGTKNSLHILSIQNDFLDHNGTGINKVLTLQIKAQGNFKPIVSFTAALEQGSLMTQIEQLSISRDPEDTTRLMLLDMNLSVMGISL